MQYAPQQSASLSASADAAAEVSRRSAGAPDSSPWLSLNAVHAGYGRRRSPNHFVEVVRGLSLELARGEIGCLLGSSGCGKTTVLRAIAGLLPVRSGTIRIGERIVSATHQHVAPEQRRIGVVFQDYALFPHLDVAANVGFGLRGMEPRARSDRVMQWLERVGLSTHATRYPHELSGGQQQRVALARALAPAPDLLLMDEPFSNLDVELRERLGNEVRELLKTAGTTAVLVTHDQHEAFAMADRIGILNDGSQEQWDTPYNLYHRPASRFVADFIGFGTFVPGQMRPGVKGPEVDIELGCLPLPPGALPFSQVLDVDVLLRPDDVIHDDASPLQATVIRKVFRGAEFLYTLRTRGGCEILALVPSHHNHAVGEAIGIRLDADHVVTFPRQG